MDVAGVAATGEPTALPTERERVDHSILVASPHFLQTLALFSAENPDVHPFLGGGCHFVAIGSQHYAAEH